MPLKWTLGPSCLFTTSSKRRRQVWGKYWNFLGMPHKGLIETQLATLAGFGPAWLSLTRALAPRHPGAGLPFVPKNKKHLSEFWRSFWLSRRVQNPHQRQPSEAPKELERRMGGGNSEASGGSERRRVYCRIQRRTRLRQGFGTGKNETNETVMILSEPQHCQEAWGIKDNIWLHILNNISNQG